MSSNKVLIEGPILGGFVTIHVENEVRNLFNFIFLILQFLKFTLFIFSNRYGEIDPAFFQQVDNYQFEHT
jgi:hypothetical protein